MCPKMALFAMAALVSAGSAWCAESKLSDAMKNGTLYRSNAAGKNQKGGENGGVGANVFGEEASLKAEVRRYLGECGSANGDDNSESSYGWGDNRNNNNNNNNRHKNRNKNEDENSSDYRGNKNGFNNNNNNNRGNRYNNRYNNQNGDDCNNRDGYNNRYNNNNNNNKFMDRHNSNYQNYDAYSSNHRHGSNCNHNQGGDGFGSNYGNNGRGQGYGGYGSQNGYNQQDYGYNGNQGGYGNPTNGFFGSSTYDRNNQNSDNRYSLFRTKRSSGDDAQCVSQCVFGYLEVLDDNRVPSETLLIKWLQDHMSGDVKRIRALREARRCFARLATSGTDDGCEFSKSLSECLNLEIE